jgi:hypothetical protein
MSKGVCRWRWNRTIAQSIIQHWYDAANTPIAYTTELKVGKILGRVSGRVPAGCQAPPLPKACLDRNAALYKSDASHQRR